MRAKCCRKRNAYHVDHRVGWVVDAAWMRAKLLQVPHVRQVLCHVRIHVLVHVVNMRVTTNGAHVAARRIGEVEHTALVQKEGWDLGKIGGRSVPQCFS